MSTLAEGRSGGRAYNTVLQAVDRHRRTAPGNKPGPERASSRIDTERRILREGAAVFVWAIVSARPTQHFDGMSGGTAVG